MISVCHNHHSTTWIGWWFNVVINPAGMVDSGGLMPFLLDTQYRSHPVIAEATKTATRIRVVESDDPMRTQGTKGF